LIKADTL